MVSILTLTYQRHQLLEEAIKSYLLQYEGHKDTSEMVIINDSPEVEYIFEHPNVRIINLKERFTSIGKKLEWGFKQCKYEWIYRLDDDDLLSPYALEINAQYQKDYPKKDILRDQKNYFFVHNKYSGLGDSINNGNCYSAEYIKRVGAIIDKSVGEDDWLTFHNKADIHIGDLGKYTMIYRWGMATYHLSHYIDEVDRNIFKIIDKSNKESGTIILKPIFRENYWDRLPEPK